MIPCSTGLRAETTIGIVLTTAFNTRAQLCELVTMTSGESRRMSSITDDQSFLPPDQLSKPAFQLTERFLPST